MEKIFELRPADYLGEIAAHELKNAPRTLYACGDLGLLRKGPRVAVVGSRKASDEGRRRTTAFVQTLVTRDMVVISGLAEGIDTVAHISAIEMGGSTIAVLGTSLDRTYPAQNRELQHTIMKHHLAVSQFPSGYATSPKNFVLRNRTMALLADATVIVEAGEKSGTEHQAWEALRLGRHVLVFESVLAKGIAWAEKIVKYGAQVLRRDNVEEILDELPAFTSLATTQDAFAL